MQITSFETVLHGQSCWQLVYQRNSDKMQVLNSWCCVASSSLSEIGKENEKCHPRMWKTQHSRCDESANIIESAYGTSSNNFYFNKHPGRLFQTGLNFRQWTCGLRIQLPLIASGQKGRSRTPLATRSENRRPYPQASKHGVHKPSLTSFHC